MSLSPTISTVLPLPIGNFFFIDVLVTCRRRLFKFENQDNMGLDFSGVNNVVAQAESYPSELANNKIA